MLSTAPSATLPGIDCAGSGVRFLGLEVGERNRRAFHRCARADGRLKVPSGVVITPALGAALPAAPGVWHLVWGRAKPPLVWMVGPAVELPSPRAVVDVPAGAVLDVSTPAARRRSARRLLDRSGKPTDGWMSRHVHRKVSRACARPALRLGVSANQATLATLLLGLAAAWCFARTGRPTLVLGGLLFWLASMADGIDGEIARLTFTESAAGAQLDTLADDLTYASCYAGATIGWWRQGMGWPGAAVVAGTLVALAATVLWATRLVTRNGPPGKRRLVPLTPIEHAVVDAAAATGKPPLRAAAAVFQIFRRELFSPALFVASLTTARRAVLPVVIAAGLGLALTVLIVYRRDVGTAMRARYRAAPDAV